MSIALARQPDCIQVFLFSLPHEERLEPAVQKIQQVLARLPGLIGGVNLMNQRRVLYHFPVGFVLFRSQKRFHSSYPRKRVSSCSVADWIPAFAGMTKIY
jgi:hypothetical protein